MAHDGNNGAGELDALIRQRIGEWQKELLQLTRRNNLLYFRPGRSAVEISGPAPDVLYQRLRGASKGLKFASAAAPPTGPYGGFEVEPEAVPVEPEVVAGDIATTHEVGDLQRRLRNLRRKDREWQEEQGLNVLFLALGFLHWVNADGEQARSPLVLVPCDLERQSPGVPFRLRREDDDSAINPTLRHRLSEAGIDLPELDEDSDEDTSIELYLAAVAELVDGRPGWHVDAEIVLGTFSYSKLAMYQDLERMKNAGSAGIRSDLVRFLASDRKSQFAGSAGGSAMPPEKELSGGRLDDLLELRDQFAVLPADFSQLQAIEVARRGGNLVIHGPPGTGKSQTIANLIATMIADGKRVLFVSEKTAALDVVKRRLAECDLGVFCLDLHSDRGRKAEVYRQLQASLDDKREVATGDDSSDQLVERRDRLNSMTRLLHEQREPLGQSVFEVQGGFQLRRHYPRFEALALPRQKQVTGEWLNRTVAAAENIARRPREFKEHHTSRWKALRTPDSALNLVDLIRQEVQTVLAGVEEVDSAASQVARWLGKPDVGSKAEVETALALLGLLAEAPGVPVAWLADGALAGLKRQQKHQAERQRERRCLEAQLSQSFGGAPPAVDYRAVRDKISIPPGELYAIASAAGPDWDVKLARDPVGTSERVDALASGLDRLIDSAAKLAEALGEAPASTLAQAEAAGERGSRVLALDPVPGHWLEPPELDAVESKCAQWRSLADRLSSQEGRLEPDFSDGLVSLVDEQTLVRYRTDHQGSVRRALGTQYRRDRRVVHGQLLTPRKLSPDEQRKGVELALEVKRLREQWAGIESDIGESLGRRFKGRETDWEQVVGDIRELRGLIADSQERREVTGALRSGGERQVLRAAVVSVQDAVRDYRAAAEDLGSDALDDPERKFGPVSETLERAAKAVGRVRDATAELVSSLAEPATDFDALVELVTRGSRLAEMIDEDEKAAPVLADDFGPYFSGAATDWSAAESALDWTTRFRDATGTSVSDELRCHATEPREAVEYSSRARYLGALLGSYTETLRVLDQRFDVGSTGWPTWDAAPFADLGDWATDLGEAADEAPDWVQYRAAVAALDEHLGDGSTDALRELTERAEDVPAILERRAYERWLESVYEDEPALRQFDRIGHEAIRERFRELDEKFPMAARARVREEGFRKYPTTDATTNQGDLPKLKAELAKKKRTKSVRSLMATIPEVVQRLKPCFLMSPLAVSQYLPPGTENGSRADFDAVIFDEASQVRPAEAIPAIERANQVIVAGDANQLPPTTFFLGGSDDSDHDDDDDDSADNPLEDRESILDVMVPMVGQIAAESHLSVHYRSRCEGLIRFSNHAFYDNRLLTFPGPDPGDACVRDVYLPDATYDAGKSRTNRREAERVSEIVFELIETLPGDESVGVVALSRAQADLIEDLIENGRLGRRHLDDRFQEGRTERFFVKNLENVQGDERDHMILSVGYGPTPAGTVPNRFGPINRDGGERRLNVAVTRARKSMTVVHSLLPKHITSEAAGTRQLRRYLEYARDPDTSLEAEVTGTGEPESPFEDAVLAALRERGHLVDSQVGVSGYRIDLAIRPDDGAGYDLGIECDGATYHRAPAARDRDWLRQRVLEGLGWRIHRVWSTAWIKNPLGEIKAIEEALERARADHLPGPPPAPVGPPTSPSDAAPPAAHAGPGAALPRESESTDEDHPVSPAGGGSAAGTSAAEHPLDAMDDAGDTARSGLFGEYRRFSGEPLVGDPMKIPLQTLAERIARVVRAEQPVHVDVVVDRLRESLTAQRIKEPLRKRIDLAVNQAVLNAEVGRDNGFLWAAGELGRAVRPRQCPDRPVDHVADAELDAGLVLVAETAFGAVPEELVRETARQFGWRRTGRNIRERLDGRIECLVESGRLRWRGGTLVAADDDSAAK